MLSVWSKHLEPVPYDSSAKFFSGSVIKEKVINFNIIFSRGGAGYNTRHIHTMEVSYHRLKKGSPEISVGDFMIILDKKEFVPSR